MSPVIVASFQAEEIPPLRSFMAAEAIAANTAKNKVLAELLSSEFPQHAKRLVDCGREIDGGRQYCRLWRLCPTCHVINSHLIRQQFEDSIAATSKRLNQRYRLHSFVIHPFSRFEKTDTETLHQASEAIRRFIYALSQYRTRHNATLQADPAAAIYRNQLGPIMLATHIQPDIHRLEPRTTQIRRYTPKLHLHVLAALPLSYQPLLLFNKLRDLWYQPEGSPDFQIENRTGGAIKQLRLPLDPSEAHRQNHIAYLARAHKTSWEADQIVASFRISQRLPQRTFVTLLGATAKRREQPSFQQVISQPVKLSQIT